MTNTLEENKEKLNTYVAYCKRHENCCNKDDNQYRNILEQKNIGETSISELYKWIFDVTSNTSDVRIKKLKEYCIKEFLLKIKDNIKDKNNCTIKNLDALINLVISDLRLVTIDYTDIALISQNANFVCAIENKIAAKIQTYGDDSTQIEKYKEVTIKNYSDYNKAFVFICANKDYYPEDDFINHCSNKKKYNGKYKKAKVKQLLEDNGYIILEHYDIVEILYNYLLENNKILFDKNRILIPTYHFNEEVSNILGDNENEAKASEKIPFLSILKDKEYKQIIYLLCQYIEYCELHRTSNAKTDNFIPYTKIIDKKLLWNICYDIKKYYIKSGAEAEWKNIKAYYSEYCLPDPNIKIK